MRLFPRVSAIRIFLLPGSAEPLRFAMAASEGFKPMERESALPAHIPVLAVVIDKHLDRGIRLGVASFFHGEPGHLVGCRSLVVAVAAVGACGSWLQDGVAGSGPCRGERNGLPLVVRGFESRERIIGATTVQNATKTFCEENPRPGHRKIHGGWRRTTPLPGQLSASGGGLFPATLQDSPRKRLCRLVGWRVAPGDSRIKQSV